MKKVLTSILFSLLLIFSLASCGKNNERIKNTLNNLNTTAFDRNGQTHSFSHKYEAESHTNDEYEKVDYTIKYEGNGIISTAIEGLNEDINKFSFYELITTKIGYIRVVQQEKYDYNYKMEDKYDNKKIEDKSNYEMYHEFIIKFDESTIYVSSVSKYTDSNDNTKTVDATFNGKISKETFTNSVTPDTVNYLYNELLVMSEFETNLKVENYTTDKFIKAKDLNDSDFNSFVKENQITIDESNNQATIGLSYPCNSVISSLFKLESKSNSKINGKLVVDNEKKDIIHFEYDLKDFIFDTLDHMDDEDLVKTNINEFILTGDSFNTKVSDIKLEKDFKEYTDSFEFLNSLYSVMPIYY